MTGDKLRRWRFKSGLSVLSFGLALGLNGAADNIRREVRRLEAARNEDILPRYESAAKRLRSQMERDEAWD